MRLLLVGDPHIKITNLDIAEKFFSFLLDLQEEHRPDKVVVLGDLFDTHAIIRSEVLNYWIAYLKQANARFGKTHILLKGNHDEAGPGSRHHALAALRPFAQIVDSWCSFKNIFFIAYTPDRDKFHRNLNFYNSIGEQRNHSILFCHQTFDGASYENGFYDPHGYPLEWLKDYKIVVSGHIHKKQQFSNVFYPGTPFAHSFNDANEKKYIWLFDTELFEFKKFNTELPEYIVKDFDDVKKASEWLDKQDIKNYYKLKVKDSHSAIRSYQDSEEFKKIKKKMRIALSPEYTDTVQLEERISDSISPEKMIVEFVDHYMSTKLDKKKLTEMCMDYFQKAK